MLRIAAGPHAAYVTLDSVRAVKQSGNFTGIKSDPITTLHGYSNGAMTVGWVSSIPRRRFRWFINFLEKASELQPTYAPELKIVGAALGGLIPNITALTEIGMKFYDVFKVVLWLKSLTEGFITGERARFGPTVVLGIAHDYKNFSQWLDQNLIPEKASIYRKPEHQCFDSNDMFAFMNLNQFYKRGYKSLRDPLPNQVLRIAGEDFQLHMIYCLF
jgi:hypothetical protein